MPLEDLAIVSDLLDRLIGPVGGEAIFLAEIVADAEQTLDLRYLALLHLVDIRLRDAEFFGGDQREEGPAHDVRRPRDAEFFGGDQREEGPAHDVRPLAVVLAHDRSDRPRGEELGQAEA